MIRPRVDNVIKLLLWSLALIWLSQQGTAMLADRHYAKHEQRVLDFAHRQEVKADSLQEIADSLSNERDTTVVTLTLRTEKVRFITQTLPPPATPTDTLRDNIIATQDSIIVGLNGAVDLSKQVEAQLRGSLVSLQSAHDSLVAFIQKPKPKPSRLSIGVGVGMCVGVNGTQAYNGPCVSVGLNWKIL